MKLSDTFLSHDDGNEKLVVSTGSAKFCGMARGNETAGFIITCLEQETTEDEIVSKMLAKYDAPEEIIRRDVKKIISQLREIGAING